MKSNFYFVYTNDVQIQLPGALTWETWQDLSCTDLPYMLFRMSYLQISLFHSHLLHRKHDRQFLKTGNVWLYCQLFKVVHNWRHHSLCFCSCFDYIFLHSLIYLSLAYDFHNNTDGQTGTCSPWGQRDIFHPSYGQVKRHQEEIDNLHSVWAPSSGLSGLWIGTCRYFLPNFFLGTLLLQAGLN